MEEKRPFGDYIRKKRLEAGLTQKELAGRLFVTESSVSKWERVSPSTSSSPPATTSRLRPRPGRRLCGGGW